MSGTSNNSNAARIFGNFVMNGSANTFKPSKDKDTKLWQQDSAEATGMDAETKAWKEFQRLKGSFSKKYGFPYLHSEA